jgi:hypothetical protein
MILMNILVAQNTQKLQIKNQYSFQPRVTNLNSMISNNAKNDLLFNKYLYLKVINSIHINH